MAASTPHEIAQRIVNRAIELGQQGFDVTLQGMADDIADALATERRLRIDQGLKAGALLGKEWDGASIEELAAEIVNLRRLRAQAEQEQWQPISTAPKDGTEVILAVDGGVDIANWQEEKPDGTECGVVVDPGLPAGWYGYLGLCPWDTAQPTHWMPLPAAPSVALPHTHETTPEPETP